MIPSAIRVALVVGAAVSITGCEPGTTVADEGTSGDTGTLVLSEPALGEGAFRQIDGERLSPVVVVDGLQRPVERRDGEWTAVLSLGDRSVLDFVVEWRYTLEDGAVLVVARSESVRLDTRATPRRVTVDEYVTSVFDEDGDRIDNLAELRAGSDPRVASTTARAFPIELGVPDLAFGVLAADELIVEATLDGVPLDLVREGGGWRGGFAIDDNLSHRYAVTWSTLVEGAPLVVLSSARILVTRGSPEGVLRIDAYADSPHDVDGDGRSNLAEIEAGSDPLRAEGGGTGRPLP